MAIASYVVDAAPVRERLVERQRTYELVQLPESDPPTVTVLSPSPGATLEPAGFVEILVEDPGTGAGRSGLRSVTVAAELPDGTEEVIYRRGAFRGRYLAGSSSSATAKGIRLRCARAGGWPSGALSFHAEVVDGAGNEAT